MRRIRGIRGIRETRETREIKITNSQFPYFDFS
jgi:hypothetical protein